jgi:hypothetical protein
VAVGVEDSRVFTGDDFVDMALDGFNELRVFD